MTLKCVYMPSRAIVAASAAYTYTYHTDIDGHIHLSSSRSCMAEVMLRLFFLHCSYTFFFLFVYRFLPWQPEICMFIQRNSESVK